VYWGRAGGASADFGGGSDEARREGLNKLPHSTLGSDGGRMRRTAAIAFLIATARFKTSVLEFISLATSWSSRGVPD
jgi:hypothetical protein